MLLSTEAGDSRAGGVRGKRERTRLKPCEWETVQGSWGSDMVHGFMAPVSVPCKI